MSAPVDKAWPKEGNIFKTKEDVLLVCQLAALKAGFSQLEVSTDNRRGEDWAEIRCNARNEGRSRCQHRILAMTMVDHTNHKLGWRIAQVRRDNLEALRHSKHRGVSKPLKLPQPPFSLSVGDVIQRGEQLHLLEATLRISARLCNRYIFIYLKANPLYKDPGHRLHLTCARGHGGCSFFVRLNETAQGNFRCTEVEPSHNCGRTAVEVAGGKLSSKMSVFPLITLVRGVIGEHQKIEGTARNRGDPEYLREDSDFSDSDAGGIADLAEDPPPSELPPPLGKVYSASTPSAPNSGATASAARLLHNSTDVGTKERKEKKKMTEVEQSALAETKEQPRERTRVEKQPSGLAKATILNPRPIRNPRAAESSPPARSSSPQLKTYRHHGKQETEHERKARRKREREERTGVIESHEQRQERRKGKAEKQRRALDDDEGSVARTVIDIDSDIEIISFTPARPSAKAPASTKKPDPRPSTSSAAPSPASANAEKPVKIFMYKGKIETNSERKVRRKKERELKTGVVESHEERKVRRQLKKLKDAKRAAERALKRAGRG